MQYGGTKMRVWITKHALTKGILQKEVPTYVEFDSLGTMIHVLVPQYNEPDWHTTYAGAVARAEEMRKEKIAKLEEKIERLKKLKFE
jgi:hypothetical protein